MERPQHSDLGRQDCFRNHSGSQSQCYPSMFYRCRSESLNILFMRNFRHCANKAYNSSSGPSISINTKNNNEENKQNQEKRMDICDQVLIIQNPDGTIQIGTQPHLKNKKVMDCYQCRAKIIFDGQYHQLKCGRCQALNQVPGSVPPPPPPPKTMMCAICHGQARVIPHNEILFAHCQRCGAVTGII